MKTAVITGASRGMGLAIAKKFLDEKWNVIGTYNKNKIPVKSEHLTSVKLDLSSPESVSGAAKEILKSAPKIDVLVNNAGIILDAHESKANLEKIRKTLEVNLLEVIDFTEKLLPDVVSGGHIINMDSQYGAFSFPIDDGTSAGYRLSKAALNMYTRVLAFRLKEKDIIVSSFDPGWVKTDMGMDVATETEKPNREPDEVAQEIYKLATSKVSSGQFWFKGKNREW